MIWYNDPRLKPAQVGFYRRILIGIKYGCIYKIPPRVYTGINSIVTSNMYASDFDGGTVGDWKGQGKSLKKGGVR